MARIVLFVRLYFGHKIKKMDVEAKSLDKKSLDKKSLDKKSLDKKSLDKETLDEETLDEETLDEETFIKSLDEKELMAYNIAKSHLGTMFSLDKSNAFLEWKAKAKP
jgi:hypothetical protein